MRLFISDLKVGWHPGFHSFVIVIVLATFEGSTHAVVLSPKCRVHKLESSSLQPIPNKTQYTDYYHNRESQESFRWVEWSIALACTLPLKQHLLFCVGLFYWSVTQQFVQPAGAEINVLKSMAGKGKSKMTWFKWFSSSGELGAWRILTLLTSITSLSLSCHQHYNYMYKGWHYIENALINRWNNSE